MAIDIAPELSSKEYEQYLDERAEEYNRHLAELDRQEFEAIERLENIKTQQTVARAKVDADKWRNLFHTREEIENAPPIGFAIQDFLQDDAVTILAGLPGHGKTLIALALTQSLLTGSSLFDLFAVNRKAERVLYLVPESALTPFAERLKVFKLTEFIGERLFVRTLSATGGDITLIDGRLLEAVKGADVVLDTAIRFLPTDTDENNAGEMRVFSRQLFGLLKHGAKSVTALHHSPKGTRKATQLDLENALRGSGDLGGMCATAWASYQLDKDSCKLYVENVKARDFQASPGFLLEGRPHLDNTSKFKLLNAACESLSDAKKTEKNDKMVFAKRLQDEGMSLRDIAKTMDVKSPQTVSNWLKK